MEQNENIEVEAPGTKYGALRLPKDVLDDLAVWKIAYERHLGWRIHYKTMVRGFLENHRIPDEVVRIHDEIVKERKNK